MTQDSPIRLRELLRFSSDRSLTAFLYTMLLLEFVVLPFWSLTTYGELIVDGFVALENHLVAEDVGKSEWRFRLCIRAQNKEGADDCQWIPHVSVLCLNCVHCSKSCHHRSGH